jgi:PKD domain
MKTRACWTLLLSLASAACGQDGGLTTSTANRPPTVDAFQNPDGDALVGVTTMTFSAFAIDPDGDAVTCSWDLGDGMPRPGMRAERTYATPGIFPVTITCTDGRGGSVSGSHSVTARLPPGV